MNWLVLAAAEGELAPLNEHEVLLLLVQLGLLVGAARLLGGVMKRFGQPAVVGELLAGILLGPTVFKNVWPSAYTWVFDSEPVVTSVVFGLAWLGVIMLLVAIGFETDLAIIGRFRGAALWVSAGSLLVPLGVFIGVAQLLPDSFLGDKGTRSLFALFFALALSVSALPVVAKILQDLGFLRRNFGQITLAAGMTMDGVGWLILAALSGVALQGSLEVRSLLSSLAGLIIFLLAAATAGRWLLDQLYRQALRGGSSETAALTTTLVAALVGAAVTQALQLEAILGAFIMGILMGMTRTHLPKVREILETMTNAFFAPIFFAFSGLRVDFGALDSAAAIGWTLAVIVLAVLAKVVGTYLGARKGGLDHREGLALGSGLSALGAMGIVVAIVAFNLQMISNAGFTVLVLAAVATSVLAPQLLRMSVKDWAIPDEERARLDQEALRDSSVILRARRVLLPTRGGRNSVYAAKLLGAVFPEMELTILAVDPGEPGLLNRLLRRRSGRSDPSPVVEAVSHLEGVKVDVVNRVARDITTAVAAEAQLGYDLVVLGASEEESDGSRIFSNVVERILGRLTIPSLVVRFPAAAQPALELPERVLVPVTRSASARAAEEMAYSISRSSHGSVTALHVVNRPEGQGALVEQARISESTDAAVTMLAEAAELGAKLGVSVETSVIVAPQAEAAIIAEANGGEYDLLLLGSATRPLSNRAFFGHRVTYIIENSTIPVAILSLPDQAFPDPVMLFGE